MTSRWTRSSTRCLFLLELRPRLPVPLPAGVDTRTCTNSCGGDKGAPDVVVEVTESSAESGGCALGTLISNCSSWAKLVAEDEGDSSCLFFLGDEATDPEGATAAAVSSLDLRFMSPRIEASEICIPENYFRA